MHESGPTEEARSSSGANGDSSPDSVAHDPRPLRTGGLPHDRGLWLAIAWVTILVIAAVGFDWLPLGDAFATSAAEARQGPSLAHPLGTDRLGRDILARVILGARVSLSIAVMATLTGGFVGSIVGIAAGYFRGRIENVLMGLVDVLLAFPGIILAITLIALLGNSVGNVTIALSIFAVPSFARIARSVTLSVSRRGFVTAARIMGAKQPRVVLYEVVPNVVASVLAYALVVLAIAIIAEGTLSFLGLGVPPPTPSWGAMIEGGRGDLTRSPHISLIPAAVMFLTVLSINYVGERVRQLFDVKRQDDLR